MEVTVVAGQVDRLREQVVERVARAAPAPAVVVRHDLSDVAGGVVTRLSIDVGGGGVTVEQVPLEHPCGSCAVRYSVVPHLLDLAAAGTAWAVVSVPAPVEPQTVAEALAEALDGSSGRDLLHVDTVVTVVDADRLVQDLDGDDLLDDRGIAVAAGDRRCVAEVACRQVEYADVLAVLGDTDLVHHLNPAAALVDLRAFRASALLRRRSHDPDRAALWVEPGCPSAPLAERTGRVSTLVWRADRPFHPGRLYDALQDLVAPVGRGRGSLWLAGTRDERLCWDSAGGHLAMGSLGAWLVDLPPDRHREAGAGHRARAALEWHPEHGDRGSFLVLTGVDLDVPAQTAALDACLLDPAEWADVRRGRVVLDDPFAAHLDRADDGTDGPADPDGLDAGRPVAIEDRQG